MADETEKNVAESAPSQSPEQKDASSSAPSVSVTSSNDATSVVTPNNAQISGVNSSATVSSGTNTNSPGASPDGMRKPDKRNVFAVFADTMRHIDNCEKDKTIVFRTNDKKSVIFMLLAFGVEVLLMFLFVANSASRPIYIALAAVADVFFGMAILWYVLLRFGVLRFFEPRQTVLAWQLMIGAGALFAFYTMNIAFAFFTYYSALSSQTIHPL